MSHRIKLCLLLFIINGCSTTGVEKLSYEQAVDKFVSQNNAALKVSDSCNKSTDAAQSLEKQGIFPQGIKQAMDNSWNKARSDCHTEESKGKSGVVYLVSESGNVSEVWLQEGSYNAECVESIIMLSKYPNFHRQYYISVGY